MPDVVCIVESWLDEEIGSNEILLPNFVSVRLDRNRRGSGVLLWIRDNVAFKVLELGPHDLELIFISISLPKQKNMCLGVLYHPPSSSTALFDTLLDIIYNVNPFTFSQFVLIGDFNTNMLVHSSNRNYVLSLCNYFNLSQMVRDSTYVRSDGYSSLLDLVLVSDPICVLHCCTIPP